jgi:hypothetical protein
LYISSRFPDGLFSNQKSQFGSILEGLAMENVGIFNVLLVNFTAILNILRLFGIVFDHLVCFPVLVSCTKKNLATLYLITKLGI